MAKVRKKPLNVYVIFLIKQELHKRTEQFFGVKRTQSDATYFCRHMITPKECQENIKYGNFYIPVSDEEGVVAEIPVNFEAPELGLKSDTIPTEGKLLIKGIDFTRKDEGRSNNNPRWYWNIAHIQL